mmetsp:Transcript_16048/g.31699  ORF Transcript_16048/g.31699 Transcript_16048/m.31699 type:complete len:338 (-) Transcript_16048:159-1172(-)
MREAYFGVMMKGVQHVCRFIESFEEQDGDTTDLWLVFRSEGLSLKNYLYEATVDETFVSYHPGAFWRQYRSSPQGHSGIRELMRQLLEGIASCHDKNVTHRDVKPSNLIVHIPTHEEQQMDPSGEPVLKLADFGSAVDEYSTNNLYGLRGPSLDDETLDYAPPEVLFGDGIACDAMRPHSYDMWSSGVLLMELVLGTSKVFQVSGRTRAMISHRMHASSAEAIEQACLLRAMVELRIFPPEGGGERAKEGVAEKEDDETVVDNEIRGRDELGLGMPNIWAVRLLRRMLRWVPDERISAKRALDHAYFRKDGKGFPCAGDGNVEHEFEDECKDKGCGL